MGTSANTNYAMDEKSSQEKVEHTDNRLGPAQAMSEEEFAAVEKKLKRKRDIRLTTTVWLIFVLNYLDRNNIAACITLQRANKQVARGEKSVGQAMKGEARANIAGLTDEENRERLESFRYIT